MTALIPKCLHKQTYLGLVRKRNPFFNNFFNNLSKKRFSGKNVKIYLTSSRFSFEQASFLKGGAFLFLSAFFICELYSAVCIAQRNRGFGSSLKLRFVDSGYLLEKHLLLFSPKILFISEEINKASRLYALNTKRLKSK